MTQGPAHPPRVREPVVSVENLYVRFLTREATVAAINGVSFDLEAGQVLGILGESGSGKSVTLRALPEGCSFAPRCRHAEEHCRVRMPPESTLSPERMTRCLRVAAGEIDLPSPNLSDRNVTRP